MGIADEFAAVLSGPFAYLRDYVHPVGVGDADGLPVRALLDGPQLDTALERFFPSHPGADRRAVLSMWSQWYLGLLIPPAAGTALLHGTERPLGLDDVRIVLSEKGLPHTLHLYPASPTRTDVKPTIRLEPLIRGHLAAFITAFADHTGISPRLLWSNAAVRIAAVVDAVCERTENLATRALLRDGLFGRPCWEDGERNPLFGLVRFPDGVPQPRVCCLTYKLPGYGCCIGCPTPAAPRR